MILKKVEVNVFGYENLVYPLYISKKSYDQTLNLLCIYVLCIYERF